MLEEQMTRKRLVVLAASLAVVAVLAVGGFATVFAAGSPTSTSADPSSRAQTFLDRLATNLGISTDRLQQGLKDTANQYVDQALANGRITQQQADAAKQRIANGNGLSPFTHFLGRRDAALDKLRLASWQDIATALNMSPQDLKSQIQSGQTLKQIIESHNMTVDDVVSSVVSQVKTQLDAKVSSGTITQDQETKILDALQTRLTNLINNGGPTFHQHPNPNATPAAAPSA
jgi:hypothetical protein